MNIHIKYFVIGIVATLLLFVTIPLVIITTPFWVFYLVGQDLYRTYKNPDEHAYYK